MRKARFIGNRTHEASEAADRTSSKYGSAAQREHYQSTYDPVVNQPGTTPSSGSNGATKQFRRLVQVMSKVIPLAQSQRTVDYRRARLSIASTLPSFQNGLPYVALSKVPVQLLFLAVVALAFVSIIQPCWVVVRFLAFLHAVLFIEHRRIRSLRRGTRRAR